ncbi:MAG: hypothetical protein ACXAC7_15785 [Candidatus Hodarchaeales archaeon]
MMISVLEVVMIQLPFVILLVISLILAGLAFRLRQITGEDSIIHLMTIFLLTGLLFFSLLGAYLNIDNLDMQYWFFSLGIFAFWAVLLEMGIFYLAVFVNPNRVLPSARLYIPAILGAAATISSIRVLENYGKEYTKYDVAFWELGIYLVAVIIFIAIQGILIRELYRNRKLIQINPSNLAFVDGVREIIASGTLAIIYVFISVILWFSVKTNAATGDTVVVEFSLLIQDFVLEDWLVYLNVPILLAVFFFVVLRMRRVNQVAKEIDINQIYNAIS